MLLYAPVLSAAAWLRLQALMRRQKSEGVVRIDEAMFGEVAGEEGVLEESLARRWSKIVPRMVGQKCTVGSLEVLAFLAV